MSKSIHRAIKGSFASAFSTFSSLSLGVLLPYIALLVWSAEEYGMWVAAIGWMGIWGLIDYSHQTYVGNKFTIDYQNNREIGTRSISGGITIALILAVLKLVVLCICYINLSNESSFYRSIPLLVVCSITTSPLGVVTQIYRPHGDYALAVYLTIGMSLLSSLSAGASIFLLKTSLPTTILVYSLVKLTTEVIAFLYTCKRYGLRPGAFKTVDLKAAFRNFFASFGYVVNTGLDMGVNQGSIIYLEHAGGGTQVGLYSTSRTLANIVLQNLSMIMNPVLHDFSRLWCAKDRIGFSSLVMGIGLVLSVVIALACGGLVAFGESIFIHWTHGKFGPGEWVLGFLASSAFVRVCQSPVYAYFQQFNRIKELNHASIGRFIGFAVVLGLFGVNARSMAGGTLMAEISALVVLIYHWRLVHATEGIRGGFKSLVPIVIPVFLAVALVLVAPRSVMSGFLSTVFILCALFVIWFFIHNEIRERILRNFKFLVPSLNRK